ncbi:MAG: PASTA domain-containing protein [Acidobacteriota bacterium]|nr:PASTA domain-containing protein [Acidobacteriota bacterium]
MSGDEKPAPKTRGKAARRVWLIRGALVALICTSLLACFALGSWVVLSRSVRVPDLTVPDLANLDRLEASRVLRDLGLEPQIGGQRPDPVKPEGRVLEQIPAAGAKTRPGRPVRLIVSSGPSEILIPELVGSSLRRAQVALRKAGLALASSSAAPHGSIGVGRVIAQHPPPGQHGFPGEGVSLLLSSGPRGTAYVMPSLVGWPVGRATNALEGAGFVRVRVASSGAAHSSAAAVVSQTPRPGHRVTLNVPVVLDVGFVGSAAAPPGRARSER